MILKNNYYFYFFSLILEWLSYDYIKPIVYLMYSILSDTKLINSIVYVWQTVAMKLHCFKFAFNGSSFDGFSKIRKICAKTKTQFKSLVLIENSWKSWIFFLTLIVWTIFKYESWIMLLIMQNKYYSNFRYFK